MKFAAAYYLFLIYTTVILNPILPVAEDVLMHCFADAYHIATVHAAEGKNHVEKEMADSNGTDNSSKNQKADKAEQSLHEPATVQALARFNPYFFISNYSFANVSLSNIYIDFISPPPRCA